MMELNPSILFSQTVPFAGPWCLSAVVALAPVVPRRASTGNVLLVVLAKPELGKCLHFLGF